MDIVHHKFSPDLVHSYRRSGGKPVKEGRRSICSGRGLADAESRVKKDSRWTIRELVVTWSAIQT